MGVNRITTQKMRIRGFYLNGLVQQADIKKVYPFGVYIKFVLRLSAQ